MSHSRSGLTYDSDMEFPSKRSGLAEVKAQAAYRWCAAVNATGEFGQWDYTLAYSVRDLAAHLETLVPQRSPVL